MANRHRKICYISLIIREIQVKTTVWYHITTVIIKKSSNNKRWRRCWEKSPLLHCWWKCKFVQPIRYGGSSKIWKQNCSMIKQSHSRESPHIPHPEKIIFWKVSCIPMFIAALFTIAKIWKQPKCPSTEEWIKKWRIYAVEYYSAITKSEKEPFMATWMDPETVMLSDVRQRQISYNIIICVI